jgi:hypothetical protein
MFLLIYAQGEVQLRVPISITYFVSDTILCQLISPGWYSPGIEHQTLAERSHRLGLNLDFRVGGQVWELQTWESSRVAGINSLETVSRVTSRPVVFLNRFLPPALY